MKKLALMFFLGHINFNTALNNTYAMEESEVEQNEGSFENLAPNGIDAAIKEEELDRCVAILLSIEPYIVPDAVNTEKNKEDIKRLKEFLGGKTNEELEEMNFWVSNVIVECNESGIKFSPEAGKKLWSKIIEYRVLNRSKPNYKNEKINQDEYKKYLKNAKALLGIIKDIKESKDLLELEA